MNKPSGSELLDDILDAYVTAAKIPNREVLREWIRKYPQYERELVDFTVAWIQMEELPPIKRDEPDYDILALRAMSIVQNLYNDNEQESKSSQSANSSIEKLVAEGQAQGFSPDQFATILKLSVGLLWKLDRRLILYSSIPVELMENIAATLHRGLQIVAEYLQRQPVLAENASYKANHQPKISEPRNFFDEVRGDQEIIDEYRDYWIEFESPNL